MRMMNRVLLQGRVGGVPEFRQSKSGSLVATFSLCTDRALRAGDGWAEDRDWHSVRAFGREAEYVQRAVHKGALVWVEGSMREERWTAPDGTKRSRMRVWSDKVSCVVSVPTRAIEVDEAPSEAASADYAPAEQPAVAEA